MTQSVDTHNTNKSLSLAFPRRRLLRPTTVRVLILVLFLLTFLISSGSIRRHFPDYSGERSRDTLWTKTFCEKTYYYCDDHHQDHTMTGENHRQQVEHDWATYIIQGTVTPDTTIPPAVWHDLPVKGVFYMVLQNGDIQGARETIRSIEDRFNHAYRYPWVFLSEQPFTDNFVSNIKKLSTVPMFFGRIDPEVWQYPSWISGVRLENSIQSMVDRGVDKASSLLYRQRARYHSGFYFRHPLFQDVEYAWRAEPGSYYSCDMEEKDLFLEMKERNKTLGFVMSNREDPMSMRSLWSLIEIFILENQDRILPRQQTIMPWLIGKDGNQGWPDDFSHCQILAHFGIVKLSYLRSKEYAALFEFLDSTGGFFYERWSDSIVHTFGAALFLSHDQLHFFHRIGYSYGSEAHCPLSTTYDQRCGCDLAYSTNFLPDHCTIQLLQLIDPVMYAYNRLGLNWPKRSNVDGF